MRLVLAALTATPAAATQGYRARTRGELAATVTTEPIGRERIRVAFRFPDGREASHVAGRNERPADAPARPRTIHALSAGKPARGQCAVGRGGVGTLDRALVYIVYSEYDMQGAGRSAGPPFRRCGKGGVIPRRTTVSKIPGRKPRIPRRARAGAATGGPAPVSATALFPVPLKHQTLEELAYRHIRRAITGGHLAPGQRIVVQAVARAAGISRIPVMQALRRLESEGFVRINPHKDVVVSTLSPEEFRERFLLMAALEALCVREAEGKIAPALLRRLRALQEEIRTARAAGNTARAVAADGELHRLLWEAPGLQQVAQVLQNVWDRGEYYRVIMHARRGAFAEESLAEHEEILAALEAQDTARAAHAVERHRLQAMERLGATT